MTEPDPYAELRSIAQSPRNRRKTPPNGSIGGLLAERDELLRVLQLALPFIDDAADASTFYPDSAASTKCREIVKDARLVIAKTTGVWPS